MGDPAVWGSHDRNRDPRMVLEMVAETAGDSAVIGLFGEKEIPSPKGGTGGNILSDQADLIALSNQEWKEPTLVRPRGTHID